MRIYATNTMNFKSSKNDLRFLNNIRDKDVAVFEKLQKKKIELLLKLRETKLVIEQYNHTLQNCIGNGILGDRYAALTNDLKELIEFRETLYKKLNEVNQQLLKEEEKNY